MKGDMRSFLRNVIDDLRSGRHLDVYCLLALSLVVAVLSAVGAASTDISLAVVLAGLVVLGATQLQYFKKLDAAVSNTHRPETIVVMRDEDYLIHLRNAERVSMLCIANFRFLAANSDSLHQFLQRGGALREILMDPGHAESLYVSTTRAVGSSAEVRHTRNQIALTIDKLRELARSATTKDHLLAKRARYPTSHVITWFEFRSSPDLIFVVPTGFQQRTEARPTLVLDKNANRTGYDYFAQYFENLWTWRESRPVT